MLNGENIIKVRQAHSSTMELNTVEKIQNLNIQVEADEPNNRLYDFNGSIAINDEEEYVLTIDNFIQRGAIIKSTHFIFGLVLYTGNQTKIVMSRTKPSRKSSKFEQSFNIIVFILIVFWTLLSILLATLVQLFIDFSPTRPPYFFGTPPTYGVVGDFFGLILSFALFNIFIFPFYFSVSKEVVSFFIAKFLVIDRNMYDPECSKAASVHAYYLTEELAYIDHILTI